MLFFIELFWIFGILGFFVFFFLVLLFLILEDFVKIGIAGNIAPMISVKHFFLAIFLRMVGNLKVSMNDFILQRDLIDFDAFDLLISKKLFVLTVIVKWFGPVDIMDRHKKIDQNEWAGSDNEGNPILRCLIPNELETCNISNSHAMNKSHQRSEWLHVY